MVSCFFLKDDDTRCGSIFNLKEVEFVHSAYADLSKRIFLCQNHFYSIFGQPILTIEHKLSLEYEAYLYRTWLNVKDKYQKDKADVLEKVRVGIGSENFDFDNWKKMNYRHVQDAYDRWQKLIKKQCRYENCDKVITDYYHQYVVRVHPKNPNDYTKLNFCCLDHWEVYKKRCGLRDMIGILKINKKKAILTLEDYNEKH